MNFITGLIMGTLLFIVIAYAIIFNVIDHHLDDLCERINDLEDEVYGEEDDGSPCDSDGNPIILIDDDDEDLEEGDV